MHRRRSLHYETIDFRIPHYEELRGMHTSLSKPVVTVKVESKTLRWSEVAHRLQETNNA